MGICVPFTSSVNDITFINNRQNNGNYEEYLNARVFQNCYLYNMLLLFCILLRLVVPPIFGYPNAHISSFPGGGCPTRIVLDLFCNCARGNIPLLNFVTPGQARNLVKN